MRILLIEMSRPKPGNAAFNLSINEQLKRSIQAQCALDGEDVSAVTERLYREFLRSKNIKIKTNSQRSDKPK